MSRHHLLLAALVAAPLAWVLWPSPPDDPPAGAISRVDSLRYGWPEGAEFRYRLSYRADNETARFEPMDGAPMPALTGAFAIEGDLVVRSYGPGPAGTRLGLRLENLARATVRLLDEDLLPDLDAARGQLGGEAFVDVDAQGAVHALHFEPTSSHLFRNLAQLLVSELRVALGAGTAWTREERTQHGVVETAYARVGGAVERRRIDYLSLQAETVDWTATVDGVAHAEVEPGGPLLSLKGHERVRAVDAAGAERLRAEAEFSLALVERTRFEPTPVSGLVGYRPGEPALREDEAERHLDQRIDGLTADAMLNTLATYGRFGKVPEHNQFLWRATALLQRRPELCAQLADLFASGALDEKGQLLVLDLLTSAGTEAAQAALRGALAHEGALASKKYGVMYQRLGLLAAPTADTVELVTARYLSPGPEGPQAAAYTLGSTARHLAPTDPERAEAIAARLERDLRAADPEAGETQRALIFALGNAAAGEATVRDFADHPHPELRYASAAALRHLHDPESRAALVDLAADPEHRVAQRALRSLGGADLTATELLRLRDLVTRGRMDEVAYHGLVNLLTPYAGDPVAAEMLRAILTQNLDDSRVKSRIRVLLGDA